MDADRESGPRIFYRRLFLRHLRYVWPYRGLLATGFALLLLASGLAVAGPLITRILVDEGIGKENRGLVAALAAFFLGIEALRLAVDAFQGYLLRKLGQLSMRDLRIEVFGHLQTLPFSFYERKPLGEIVTRTTGDVAALGDLFTVGMVTLLRDALLILGVSAALLAMNPKFGLMTLALAPLLGLAAAGFRRPLRAVSRGVRAALSRLSSTLQENIAGVRVIQLFGIEGERQERLRQANDEYLKAGLSSLRLHALFGPAVSLSTALAVALVFWQGGNQVLGGGMTLGVLVAFIQYMPHLLGPIRDLGDKLAILQAASAAAERVFEILDTPPGIVDRGRPEPLGRASGEVVLKNLRFGYREGEEVLHGISTVIRPGERVALVGRTGAGKTTLSRLIARFYDPGEGAVLLDGKDLREIPLRDLRKNVAVVTQDVFIFGETVLENVRLGDESISREEVIEACRLTQAHSFIERLPGGYDHVLREGGKNLSLGERQLLAFARALVRRPALLILDEATASVDTRTEREITETLARVMEGRTSIVIAHWLSTIRNADRLILIGEGRIVEEGSPSRLLSGRGIFRGFYSYAFERGRGVQ